MRGHVRKRTGYSVSIPSSSGHQFTGNRTGREVRKDAGFQSLLHQGISLLGERFRRRIDVADRFQSLLHQGISLLPAQGPAGRGQIRGVSIPSSSGHQFTVDALGRRVRHALRSVSIPSSSGHQFTASRRRAGSRCTWSSFQSLLHQGISLLDLLAGLELPAGVVFQSLLHQGISLLAWKDDPILAWMEAFQSLLHQGISLLRGNGATRRTPCAWRFNPFFIRASVYWGEGSRITIWPDTTFQSLLHQGISLLD